MRLGSEERGRDASCWKPEFFGLPAVVLTCMEAQGGGDLQPGCSLEWGPGELLREGPAGGLRCLEEGRAVPGWWWSVAGALAVPSPGADGLIPSGALPFEQRLGCCLRWRGLD